MGYCKSITALRKTMDGGAGLRLCCCDSIRFLKEDVGWARAIELADAGQSLRWMRLLSDREMRPNLLALWTPLTTPPRCPCA
jgi:hypothetical protein